MRNAMSQEPWAEVVRRQSSAMKAPCVRPAHILQLNPERATRYLGLRLKHNGRCTHTAMGGINRRPRAKEEAE